MAEEIEIRKRIVQAAMEQFVKYGYSKVTMDEIAESLGMSKKTLYQYFSGKQELMQGIILSAMSDCDTFCTSMLANQDLDFAEKLRRMLAFFLSINAKMSRELVEDLKKHIPDVWKQIHEWRHTRICEQFGQVITEGISKGALRDDIDPRLLTRMYLGIVELMMNPQVLTEVSHTAPEVFESIWKVFFEGIMTPETRKSFSVGAAGTAAAREPINV